MISIEIVATSGNNGGLLVPDQCVRGGTIAGLSDSELSFIAKYKLGGSLTYRNRDTGQQLRMDNSHRVKISRYAEEMRAKKRQVR